MAIWLCDAPRLKISTESLVNQRVVEQSRADEPRHANNQPKQPDPTRAKQTNEPTQAANQSTQTNQTGSRPEHQTAKISAVSPASATSSLETDGEAGGQLEKGTAREDELKQTQASTSLSQMASSTGPPHQPAKETGSGWGKKAMAVVSPFAMQSRAAREKEKAEEDKKNAEMKQREEEDNQRLAAMHNKEKARVSLRMEGTKSEREKGFQATTRQELSCGNQGPELLWVLSEEGHMVRARNLQNREGLVPCSNLQRVIVSVRAQRDFSFEESLKKRSVVGLAPRDYMRIRQGDLIKVLNQLTDGWCEGWCPATNQAGYD
eukprot:g78370.t1